MDQPAREASNESKVRRERVGWRREVSQRPALGAAWPRNGGAVQQKEYQLVTREAKEGEGVEGKKEETIEGFITYWGPLVRGCVTRSGETKPETVVYGLRFCMTKRRLG